MRPLCLRLSAVIGSTGHPVARAFQYYVINRLNPRRDVRMMNGQMNGFHNSLIEEEEDYFLFTSESVGEGHPGESAPRASFTDLH